MRFTVRWADIILLIPLAKLRGCHSSFLRKILSMNFQNYSPMNIIGVQPNEREGKKILTD